MFPTSIYFSPSTLRLVARVLRKSHCPSFFLSAIYKLVPRMQSHSLFLHHHINKFIVLAFRYIVFSLVLFPSKSCLFKSRIASYITCGVWVLTLCHHGIGGSALALKSPLMTDKDIIKRTRRKTRRPCFGYVPHSANTPKKYRYMRLMLKLQVILHFANPQW